MNSLTILILFALMGASLAFFSLSSMDSSGMLPQVLEPESDAPLSIAAKRGPALDVLMQPAGMLRVQRVGPRKGTFIKVRTVVLAGQINHAVLPVKEEALIKATQLRVMIQIPAAWELESFHFEVTFKQARSDVVSVPWEEIQAVAGRTLSYGFSKDGRRITVSTPGRYKLTFVGPQGHAPIADHEVEIEAREVLKLEVELVNRR